jgi:hypothetical protein
MTTDDPPPAALASEASAQRGHSSEVGAPDTRSEPGSSARPALASEASDQLGHSSEVCAHSASEDACERADDTRPEPGSSARPDRAADKLIRDALLDELQREATDADGTATKKLLLVARTLVDKSIAGDVAALKELQDRIDGKPPPATAGADKRRARITFQWKDSGS